MDLAKELPTMTWRRFMVLVGQVSAKSRLAMAITKQKPVSGKAAEIAFRNWGK